MRVFDGSWNASADMRLKLAAGKKLMKGRGMLLERLNMKGLNTPPAGRPEDMRSECVRMATTCPVVIEEGG